MSLNIPPEAEAREIYVRLQVWSHGECIGIVSIPALASEEVTRLLEMDDASIDWYEASGVVRR